MAKIKGPGKVDPADLKQLEESPVSARRVIALFRGHELELVLVVGIIMVTSVISLAQPFLMRELIDVALPKANLDLLIWLVSGMVVVAGANGFLKVWQGWVATTMGQKVMHTLRVDVFSHLQEQSIAFFKRTRGGEIQARLLQDVAGLQSVVTSTATSIASNLTTVVATAVAMVALNWRLSLLSVLVLPPSIWLTRRVALVRRKVTAEKQRALADMHSQVEESLSINGALLAKTLGTGPENDAMFAETSKNLIDLSVRAQLAGRWRTAVMNTVFAAIPALLYLAAGFPQVAGGLTIGTLIAFASLQNSIFSPITGLLNTGADLVTSMALLSRVFGYLDLPVEVTEPLYPVDLRADQVRGEVRFEGVRYRFPDGTSDALSGIDVTIAPGHSLAVVGETGSGKSTLASLLVRLADPTYGRITIDGIDLRSLRSADRTRIVSMVTQETYLAHCSIAENLRRAAPDATDEQLWEALEAAQLDAVVAKLPDGLATVVGSRGHRFSGGERQRLAIARTLLVNPPILVLDEATSALDTETEREVQAALDRLMSGRTTLTIAHRLSTVRGADEIVVLAAGRVVERGRHAELLAAGGRYANLHHAVRSSEANPEGQRLIAAVGADGPALSTLPTDRPGARALPTTLRPLDLEPVAAKARPVPEPRPVAAPVLAAAVVESQPAGADTGASASGGGGLDSVVSALDKLLADQGQPLASLSFDEIYEQIAGQPFDRFHYPQRAAYPTEPTRLSDRARDRERRPPARLQEPEDDQVAVG